MSASRRVLVVEDEPTIRIVLGEYLHDEGFEVDEARDGASGLQLARRTVPAVAVVDLMLPVMDGPTLLASWVHDDVLGEVPVVLISAGPRLSEVAREVGALRWQSRSTWMSCARSSSRSWHTRSRRPLR